MSDIFFKIIIPNFNSADYIEQCLQSVLGQTYQSFSILVVDDMSTDGSKEILSRYADVFSDKVRVIFLDKKALAGGARNIGISDTEVRSKYTWFIDSDDFIPDNGVLQFLYETAVSNNNPDVVFFQYYDLFGERMSKSPVYDVLRAYNGGYSLLNCTCAPWAKIYRTAGLKPFCDNLLFGEDAIQLLRTLDVKTNRYVQLNDYLYVYRHRQDSISGSERDMRVRTLDFCHALEQELPDMKCQKTKMNIINKLAYEYRV